VPTPTSSIKTAFVDMPSFAGEEADSNHQPTFLPGPPIASTPFLAVYDSEESDDEADPSVEDHATFLTELYDEEFDEAVFELVNEAAALHHEHLTNYSTTTRKLDPEGFLEQHFEPLTRELERGLEAMAERWGNTNAAYLSEKEIDEIFEQFNPSVELSPGFENFFGKIGDALKKVAKKGVDLAKKGISVLAGPIFLQLKALVKPLINRVLRFAIGKIPQSLRPIAQRLARRMGLLKKEAEASDYPEYEDEPDGDISQIQFEFNEHLADFLFATSEVQRELEISHVAAESREPFDNSMAELDDARDQFINELTRLKDGEDATPLVENFLPAVLPVLKMGLKVVGRKRVMGFLSNLIAKLIARFIGRKHAKALAGAMVDAGFGLLNLETPDEDRAAAAAVAATVEDTVRRVADLPDYVLDDQELLEAFAVDAFEQAAAANLPPVLPEETYAKRPELRESKSMKGAWLMTPLQRPRYKKFCRILRTRISPHKARAVETFGGTSLAEFLEDQLGIVPGSDFDADVHLYESIPGTMLPEIARLEINTPGLGTNSEAGYGQLHPLTPEAADALFGEPGLGRELDDPLDRISTEPGNRFYYLTRPGSKPVLRRDHRQRVRLRRPGGLKVILDFPKRQLKVCIYLSEVKAQGVTMRLRQKAHAGGTLAVLRGLIDRGLLQAFKRGGRGRLKIIHETVTPEEAFGGALKLIPPVVLKRVRSLLMGWLLKGLVEFLKTRAPQFVAAAEAPQDGVTLIATISNPPGFDVLRRVLKGRIPSLASLKISGSPADVKFDVVPGYSHG
jgi:hypothetical protein